MGRLKDLGWWLREHVGGIALVLALLACGAGAAGIVIAMDAKDDAEAAAALAASTSSTVPPPPIDAEVQDEVDELNQRVAAIEESVAQLRTEGGATAPTSPEDTTSTSGDTTAPELPEGIELPEGVELPGAGSPESEPKP